jgi:hypothetical protein
VPPLFGLMSAREGPAAFSLAPLEDLNPMMVYPNLTWRLSEVPEFDPNIAMLPETARIVDGVRTEGQDWDGELGETPGGGRTASYLARPGCDLPFPWFTLIQADPDLPAFSGTSLSDFEARQVIVGSLQHHWRDDLRQAFEGEDMLVSRLCVVTSDQDLVLEHVVVPSFDEYGSCELRGWFVLDEELARLEGWAGTHGQLPVRRLEGFHPPRAPSPGPSSIDPNDLPLAMLGHLKEAWRSFTGRGSQKD